MEANTVQIDRSGDAPVFRFSDSFNVAVHMIDRHIDEGRKHRTAYITEHETVTYGQLVERVSRCGNAPGRGYSYWRADAYDRQGLSGIRLSVLRGNKGWHHSSAD
jgi:hypothetical protein